MKKLILCSLACFISLTSFAKEIVVPEMELGHWVTTTDISAMLEKTLSSVPEASRAMMRKMMEKEMKESSTSEQCITKESLSNFDQQIKETLGDNSHCKFDVIESNSKTLIATLKCSDSLIQINTKFINSKLSKSTITSDVTGIETTKITSTTEWKSSVCPKGL